MVSVYYAAPHRNVEQNSGVATHLHGQGISVAVPFDEVQQATGTASPSDGSRVREICISAIDRCDGLVVDVDVYGLDTAWEIGYAEGLGKFVIGLNHDASLRNISRPVNRRLYSENFMHGWKSQLIFKELKEACDYVKGRSVYLCGSFSNEYIKSAEEHLRGSAEHVIFPRDYVPENLPRDYPLRTRENAIHQLETCDVVLVALPRYGMDSSWQIGFATAVGKDIVGLMLPDDKGSGDLKTLWDHWMHGWHDKDVFTGRGKLAAALVAFATEDLIKRAATTSA